MEHDQLSESWDHRDRAVMEALDDADAEEVTLTDLRHTYRTTTDVRAPETLSERVRHLVERGPFERVEFQTWRYTD